MTDRRTAIAYIRVSSTRGREDSLQSPERQRDAIDAWCRRNDIDVVQEYRDLNRSGLILTRPGLQAAMAMVPAVADGIVVAYAKRASRNTLNGLQIIERMREVGGFIAAADGSIDTTTPNAVQATTMNFAMGQREVDDQRLILAKVHETQILEKRRHMGPAPFGYLRDDRKLLVIDPERAREVVWIFEARADNKGWSEIARELRAREVRDVHGRYLVPQRIATIVRRRTYTGVAFHGQHSAPDAHPRIIDDILFETANRVRPSTSSPRATEPGDRKTPELLLTGLLRCAGCRFAMKSSRQRSGRVAWACRAQGADQTAGHSCESPARTQATDGTRLEVIVVEAAKALLSGVYAQADDDHAIERAQRSIAEVDALLDELSSLDVRDTLGPQRWTKLIQEAQIKRKLALSSLQAARKVTANPGARHWLTDDWNELTFDEQREQLRGIVKTVMVLSGSEPLAQRVHVVPIDAEVDLPRQGRLAVITPWRP
jgi:site-specific DNA recombinase